MIGLLLGINDAVDASADAMPAAGTVAACHRRYRRLLGQGRKHNPERLTHPLPRDKRGGIKQSFARNLIMRLDVHASNVLRFMRHALAPIANNLAERDIRNALAQTQAESIGLLSLIRPSPGLPRRLFLSWGIARTIRGFDARIDHALCRAYARSRLTANHRRVS